MLTLSKTISIYAKNHFWSESSRYHKTIFVQTRKKRYKKRKNSCDLSFQYTVNNICVMRNLIRSISPYSIQMRKNAGKLRTRITPNTDYFNAVKITCF